MPIKNPEAQATPPTENKKPLPEESLQNSVDEKNVATVASQTIPDARKPTRFFGRLANGWVGFRGLFTGPEAAGNPAHFSMPTEVPGSIDATDTSQNRIRSSAGNTQEPAQQAPATDEKTYGPAGMAGAISHELTGNAMTATIKRHTQEANSGKRKPPNEPYDQYGIIATLNGISAATGIEQQNRGEDTTGRIPTSPFSPEAKHAEPKEAPETPAQVPAPETAHTSTTETNPPPQEPTPGNPVSLESDGSAAKPTAILSEKTPASLSPETPLADGSAGEKAETSAPTTMDSLMQQMTDALTADPNTDVTELTDKMFALNPDAAEGFIQNSTNPAIMRALAYASARHMQQARENSSINSPSIPEDKKAKTQPDSENTSTGNGQYSQEKIADAYFGYHGDPNKQPSQPAVDHAEPKKAPESPQGSSDQLSAAPIPKTETVQAVAPQIPEPPSSQSQEHPAKTTSGTGMSDAEYRDRLNSFLGTGTTEKPGEIPDQQPVGTASEDEAPEKPLPVPEAAGATPTPTPESSTTGIESEQNPEVKEAQAKTNATKEHFKALLDLCGDQKDIKEVVEKIATLQEQFANLPAADIQGLTEDLKGKAQTAQAALQTKRDALTRTDLPENERPILNEQQNLLLTSLKILIELITTLIAKTPESALTGVVTAAQHVTKGG